MILVSQCTQRSLGKDDADSMFAWALSVLKLHFFVFRKVSQVFQVYNYNLSETVLLQTIDIDRKLGPCGAAF